MTKPKRMRWARYSTLIGEKRNACRYWGESEKERDHSEILNVGGWIILE
jgi:hypothetical protein